MKLTIIGASAVCPNPGDACASYLVAHDGFSLLLDCGPGSVSRLRQHVALHQIGGVLISHLHSDHTLDLVPFRYGLRYAPINGERSRVPLWMPPSGHAFMMQLGKVFALGAEASAPFFDDEFAIREYDPAESLAIGPFTVSFQATQHFIDCWAMRVCAGGRQLVYLADSGPCDALVNFARNADVVICEATLPAESTNSPENLGHMTAAQAGDIARRAEVPHLVLTHLWAENERQSAADAARQTFSRAVTIASSGATLLI